MAKPDAVALAAQAANQRSMVERSAALPRMIWRHAGLAAIAASMARAPCGASVPSIFQNSGVSPRRYAPAMNCASMAGRPDASNSSSGSCLRATRTSRTNGFFAPRHHACSASSLVHCSATTASSSSVR